MATIYLCGPISGLAYKDTVGWRYDASAALFDKHHCFSPMRGKQYLSNQVAIPMNQDSTELLSTDQAINARDSWDVRRCDILLANLTGAKAVSIGSLMEIADAWNLGKYIVVAMEKGNVHDHPFLRARASIIFEDIEAAVKYIGEVL